MERLSEGVCELGDFKIRLADEGDLPALIALADELAPGEADAEKRVNVLMQSLRDPDYDLLVADVEGEIVGFIDHWVIHDFVHGAKMGYVQNLYVAPNYRRRGVGSRLLQEIIERAKAKGVLEVHVSTEFENKPAIELYKKQGFLREYLQLEMEL